MRFSTKEKATLATIRETYIWTGQRTLASLIVRNNISAFLRRKVNASGLYLRSVQSIYGAIRRLDTANRAARMDSPLLV